MADHREGPGLTELESLCSQVGSCMLCDLGRSRTLAVPGEGPSDSEIMIIGEAPGFHEDQQGRPFIGAAGHYLDELLKGIQLERARVYITNMVKCRPPGNRDPRPEEVAACKAYLDRQIDLIRPKMIITLGRYSMGRYFGEVTISRIHGQAKRVGGMQVMPIFHPAAALHQPRYRTAIEEDFAKIPRLLADAARWSDGGTAEKPEDEPEQLSLF